MSYFPPDGNSSGSSGGIIPIDQGSTGGELGDNGNQVKDTLGPPTSDTLRKLISDAYRYSSSENLMFPYNHRYRGIREANKFNLNMQQLITVSSFLLPTMRANDLLLKAGEFAIYPSSAEIALFYHCREQIKFKEFLLLKADNINWYL